MSTLQVRLRPFREADLALFDRLAEDPAFSEPFEWIGFGSSEPTRRRWREDRLLGSNSRCRVVAGVEDDAAVGWVD